VGVVFVGKKPGDPVVAIEIFYYNHFFFKKKKREVAMMRFGLFEY
jgi:hypothetical protein